jgi:hypothetical protein
MSVYSATITIDEKHPNWIKTVEYCKEKGMPELIVNNFVSYVKLFERDQLIDLREVCDPVELKSAEQIIVENILGHIGRKFAMSNGLLVKCKDFEQTIMLLQDLVELWDFDLTAHDYINYCLHENWSPSEYCVTLVRFFLQNGKEFEAHHLKIYRNLNEDLIKLMIEYGVEPSDIAKSLLEKLKSENSKVIRNLNLLSTKVDILGHIDEVFFKNFNFQ